MDMDMDIMQHFQRVDDIVVPDELFNVMKTGSTEIDYTFSELGGLIPSQVVLVTGNPGSGKTTLCAVIGSKLTHTNPSRPVVFLSYEMSDFQLKMQAKKISGFSDLLISTHEFHNEPHGLKELFKALDSIHPQLVIVDSLQKMASKMPQGMSNGQVHIVQEFTKWAKTSFVPVLLIGHNSKGGDYAGPSFLKHEVDSHLCVWYDREMNERLFSMSKNRFGGNMEQYGFRITADGVYIGNEWWSKLDDQTDDEARDMVLTFTEEPAQTNINWEKFQSAATSMMQLLNDKYASAFQDGTFIGDAEKISLKWTGSRACCNPKSGVIHFGRKWFDKVGRDWKTIGYRSEKPYISRYASTMEEACMWVVIHEWTHLWKCYQHHTHKMWKALSKTAGEFPWLWSKPLTNG